MLLNDKFQILGVHSHGDGIIHYHPASTKSSGNRAKLGVFLDVYDIKLTDTELIMPEDQGGEKWSTEDTKCEGKDTDLVVRVWDKFSDKGTYHDVVTDFNNIRIINDGMVFVIAFVPKGTDIPQPPEADELPTLGAADGGAVIATTTTLAPAGSAPGTGSVPGSAPVSSDTVVGTTVLTTEPAASNTTVPAAPATTGG